MVRGEQDTEWQLLDMKSTRQSLKLNPLSMTARSVIKEDNVKALLKTKAIFD